MLLTAAIAVWSCGPPDQPLNKRKSYSGVITPGGGGAGTVTSVVAGTGLTGGTITASGTVAVDPTAVQTRVGGTCTAGNSIRVIAQDGTVTCQAAGTGTVTSVTGGTGLTGGAITSSGTIAVDPTAVQTRVGGTCASGNSIRVIAQDGTVTCQAAGTGTITGATASSGISVTGTTLGLSTGASNGQVMSWNGTGWGLNMNCSDPTQRYCFLEEFEQGATNCTTAGAKFIGALQNVGSCTMTSGNTNGHPGVWTGVTGTNATGGVRESIHASLVVFGGSVGMSCAQELVMVPALGDANTQYIFRIGFSESTAFTNSVDAVQVVYDFATNGNFWEFETRQNSTSTVTKLDGTGGTVSTPVSAGSWITFMECVDQTAANATLYANGVLVATNTTNIPTGTARATGLGFQCLNNTGAVPVTESCNVDYFMANLPFGVAR